MQLITPFPRSVALADPRSAAERLRRRVYTIDQSARQEEGISPEALSACRHAFSAGIRHYRYQCHHHLCEELCEIGRRWKSLDGARACSRIAIVYFTQRTQQVGFAIPRMKHNAHAHDHSRASRYPNGGMGSQASHASRLGPAHHGWALRVRFN